MSIVLRSTCRFVIVAALILLFTGCGQSGGDGSGGRIQVDGSSTVYPITEAVAEEFMQENRAMRVTVGVSGTGGGFEKFVRGETDINDASRPISPSEVKLAEENGVNYIELPVAYDGIAVVANPDNDWLECISSQELEEIWQPDSEIQRWNQIRDDFPDRSLSLYGPGTASGTYDYFTEAVVGESGASRTDFTASEDDNVLVQGVSGDEGSLGFFGLAYYDNNQSRLKLIGVDDGNPDNGEGCILPSNETVGNGTYQPLSRPLFIYVREEAASDPAVQKFVHFYLDNAGELAPEVGYVGLADSTYRLVRQRFDDRVTGSIYDGEGASPNAGLNELLTGTAQSSSDVQ